MRKFLLMPFILCMFMAACTNQNKDQLEVLAEGLGRSANYFIYKNDNLFTNFENKQFDPITKELADRWKPAVSTIRSEVHAMLFVIDSLQVISPSSKLLSTGKETRAFFDRLYQCKINLMAALDSTVKYFPENYQDSARTYTTNMQQQTTLLQGLAANATTDQKEKFYTLWTEKYFNKSAPQFYYAILGKLKNDLLFTENGLLEYCNKNTFSSRFCGYSNIEEATFIEQAPIKPGQEVTLKIGVLNLGTRLHRAYVNGEPVLGDYTNNNFVKHKFSAPQQPGKYSLSVKIQVKESDEQILEKSKQVSYVVIP